MHIPSLFSLAYIFVLSLHTANAMSDQECPKFFLNLEQRKNLELKIETFDKKLAANDTYYSDDSSIKFVDFMLKLSQGDISNLTQNEVYRIEALRLWCYDILMTHPNPILRTALENLEEVLLKNQFYERIEKMGLQTNLPKIGFKTLAPLPESVKGELKLLSQMNLILKFEISAVTSSDRIYQSEFTRALFNKGPRLSFINFLNDTVSVANKLLESMIKQDISKGKHDIELVSRQTSELNELLKNPMVDQYLTWLGKTWSGQNRRLAKEMQTDISTFQSLYSRLENSGATKLKIVK